MFDIDVLVRVDADMDLDLHPSGINCRPEDDEKL